jgi:large subunit ribosomal protein LP0
MSKAERKSQYFQKLTSLLESHKSIVICNVDNVGSNQLHHTRIALRGEATILMGKNTLIRKVLRGLIQENPEYEKLLPVVRGNVGFVFTNSDLKEIREKITSNRVKAPAKAGAIAPIDVFIPAGNTGMEPGKTSFFQALGIPTKIARGLIEIVSDVHLIKKGQKVGSSEATLLNMLNISPFTYGLTISHVYDSGALFDPSVLDITNESIISAFQAGAKEIAALSFALNYPTTASVPHSVINVYKDLVSISLATDYCISQVQKLKDLLSNPEALAAAQAAVAAPAAGGASKATKEAEKPKEEPKEESDEDMGFGLFD